MSLFVVLKRFETFIFVKRSTAAPVCERKVNCGATQWTDNRPEKQSLYLFLSVFRGSYFPFFFFFGSTSRLAVYFSYSSKRKAILAVSVGKGAGGRRDRRHGRGRCGPLPEEAASSAGRRDRRASCPEIGHERRGLSERRPR